MAIATATAIAAAATIGGAVISSNGAKGAARTQADSANYAADLQNQQYQQTREDFAPWREEGSDAIRAGAAMLQPGYDHTTSPGYQFRMDEGLRAVENSAAAKGLLGSGGTLKDLVRFSQGTAAGDFSDQFNRQMSIASGGQQATSTTGSLGQMAATQAGNAAMQAGNARASGYAGQAAAMGGALNNLGFLAMNGGFGGGSSSGLAGLVPSVNNTIASNPGIF